jgi:hypothetical protein
VRLADNGIAGHTAQFFSNLTCGMTFRPQISQSWRFFGDNGRFLGITLWKGGGSTKMNPNSGSSVSVRGPNIHDPASIHLNQTLYTFRSLCPSAATRVLLTVIFLQSAFGGFLCRTYFLL